MDEMGKITDVDRLKITLTSGKLDGASYKLEADMVPGLPSILSFETVEDGFYGLYQYVLDTDVDPRTWPKDPVKYIYHGFMPTGGHVDDE